MVYCKLTFHGSKGYFLKPDKVRSPNISKLVDGMLQSNISWEQRKFPQTSQWKKTPNISYQEDGILRRIFSWKQGEFSQT